MGTKSAAWADPSPAPAAAGKGWLTFSVVREKTVVTRSWAHSPLRLLQPRNHGQAAWVFTSSYGGGLLSGDVLDLQVTVERGATALLGTQASTKIYRSQPSPNFDSTQARLLLDAEVAEGGLLVVAPDPVVGFASARFVQRQRIQLAATGSLVLIDAVTAGRHGSGERWAFSSYQSHIEVKRAGKKLVHEAMSLSDQQGALAVRLGRMNVLVFAVFIGPRVRDGISTLQEQLAASPLGLRNDLLVTGSSIGAGRSGGQADGFIVRIGSTSVERAATYLRQRLRFLPELLGDDPWARKW